VIKMRGVNSALAALALAVASPVLAAGSGTVAFEFLSFSGPVSGTFMGGGSLTGNVNGQLPALTGETVSAGFSSGRTWTIGGLTFAPDVSDVNFGYTIFNPTNSAYNRIAFTPAAFSNVSVGQDFNLGTFTFQNGGWFGGGDTASFNRPTFLPFRIRTISADGPQFNQTMLGVLMHTVNVIPSGADPNLLANQQAEADWVTIYMGSSTLGNGVGSFRVYDEFALPAGFSNSGTFDLTGRFGSLLLTGLTNPVGGFITSTAAPLPFVPGGSGAIPEPASWAMLIAGFGLIGTVQRRRAVITA
jgi:hypothetical protein